MPACVPFHSLHAPLGFNVLRLAGHRLASTSSSSAHLWAHASCEAQPPARPQAATHRGRSQNCTSSSSYSGTSDSCSSAVLSGQCQQTSGAYASRALLSSWHWRWHSHDLQAAQAGADSERVSIARACCSWHWQPVPVLAAPGPGLEAAHDGIRAAGEPAGRRAARCFRAQRGQQQLASMVDSQLAGSQPARPPARRQQHLLAAGAGESVRALAVARLGVAVAALGALRVALLVHLRGQVAVRVIKVVRPQQGVTRSVPHARRAASSRDD
jgi:hypothetical protein